MIFIKRHDGVLGLPFSFSCLQVFPLGALGTIWHVFFTNRDFPAMFLEVERKASRRAKDTKMHSFSIFQFLNSGLPFKHWDDVSCQIFFEDDAQLYKGDNTFSFSHDHDCLSASDPGHNFHNCSNSSHRARTFGQSKGTTLSVN